MTIRSNKKCVSRSFMYLFFMFLIMETFSCSKNDDDSEKEVGSIVWATASAEEVESELKKTCERGDGDAGSLASDLSKNSNVVVAKASGDGQSLIVKMKGDDCYTVYSVSQEQDPFEAENGTRGSVEQTRGTNQFKTTGSRGKVAVFNYFSYLSSRKVQNRTLEYMMQDLNDHDYGVEYYPYEEMTIKNLRNVILNSKNYKAILVFSHGFADSEKKKSYFAIGETYTDWTEYNDVYDWAEETSVTKEEDDWYYRLWNGEFSSFYGKETHNVVVPVNRLAASENTFLYVGSCAGLKYPNVLQHQTKIGWDGPNCSAQAHAAVIFYKLMRGKTLADVLDDKNANTSYYYNITKDIEFDMKGWETDPLYPSTKVVADLHGIYRPTSYDAGIWTVTQPHYWVTVPDYYKHSHVWADCLIATVNHHEVLFLNDNQRLVASGFSLWCDISAATIDIFPKVIYVKATPLRSDVAPQICTAYRVENQIDENSYLALIHYNMSSDLKLSKDGAYSITLAQDEGFTKEIYLSDPMILVYAQSFKENSAVIQSKKSLETFTVNGVSFEMLKIDGGTFKMGSSDDDPDAEGMYSDEKPQHDVTLSTYYIGVTEVTQELWETVMGNNPSQYKGKYLPVDNVSWDECQVFITKLNSLTGRRFRMPTEAEWEYAAKGGKYSKGYKYAGSDDVNDVAWTCENSNGTSHPVSTKLCNELGLYDMTGNVWEWCQDYYSYNYYENSPSNNPCNNEPSEYHIHRGGSWNYIIKDLRINMRGDYFNPPSNNLRGLRLAL